MSNEVRVGQKRGYYTVEAVFEDGAKCELHPPHPHAHYVGGGWDHLSDVMKHDDKGNDEAFWKMWLPPAPISTRAVPVFNKGQVWATSMPDTKLRCVFRVDMSSVNSVDSVLCTALAKEGYSGGGKAMMFAPSVSGRHAVLVMDVGQAWPTPALTLFRGAPTAAIPAKLPPLPTGVNWAAHLLPKEIPNNGLKIKDLVVGEIRSCWGYLAARSVYRVIALDAPDRVTIDVLAEDDWLRDPPRRGHLDNQAWAGCSVRVSTVDVPVEAVGAAPKPKTIREVSTDGKNWVNYERLTDADAFDKYPWSREWTGGAMVVVKSPPECSRCHAVSKKLGSKDGICLSCYAAIDEGQAKLTRARDQHRGARIALAAVAAEKDAAARFRPAAQSRTDGFVGVWSTRARG